MKKTAIIVFVFSVLYLFSTSSTFAYGGGPGVPPGFPGFSKVKLVCEAKSFQFPFVAIPFPVCKLVRADVQQPQESDVKNRWESFIKRIENGGS